MNLAVTIAEIGVISMYRVLERNMDDDIASEMSLYIPIPESPFTERKVQEAAQKLVELNKKYLLFMTPEIALFEKLIELKWDGQVLIILPSDLDDESKNRIINNIPVGIAVSFIQEGVFPKEFIPSNGAIVTVGFSNCGRCLITKSNYRMLDSVDMRLNFR